MARCPAGHESQASDYCDTCGLVIGGESAAAAPLTATIAASAPSSASMSAAGVGGAAGAGAGGAAGGGGCPVCQAERNGRFCEECGYDFDLAEAMPQMTMTPGVPPQPGPAAAESRRERRFRRVRPRRAVSTWTRNSPAPRPRPRGRWPNRPPPRWRLSRSPSRSRPRIRVQRRRPGRSRRPSPSRRRRSPSPSSAPVAFAAVMTSSSVLLPGEELTLVVDADQAYYTAQVERGDIIEAEFPFPKYPHERRFTFAEGPVRIGRASSSRGLNPEIDLTGPPLDPAVSHLHAQLLRHDEGWVVVDLGSSNGTRLNDAEEPLEAETEIPVKPGDRIHLGVWTTITVQ